MPAPTNIDAATATVLVPGVEVEQRVDDGGVTYTVWFKYTNTSDEYQVIAWRVTGDLGGSGYRPVYTVYGTDDVEYLGTGYENGPGELAIPAAMTLYFEIFNYDGDIVPSNLTIGLEVAPDAAAQPGDVLIWGGNGAASEDWLALGVYFPAGIIRPSTGEIIGWVPTMPVGEAGDIFPTSGRILCCDENGLTGNPPPDPTQGYYFNIYDGTTFELLTQTGVESNQVPPHCRMHVPTDKAYIIQRNSGGQGHLFTIDPDGALTDLHEFGDVVSGGAINSIAVNNDETILYWGAGFPQGPLKRWDLNGEAELSDLAAMVSQYYIPDLLVMPDETIVALYYRNRSFWGTGVNQLFVRRYDASGTLLNTYTPTYDEPLYNNTPPRLGYSVDADAFWLFAHLDTAQSDIRKITLDGAEVYAAITPDAWQLEEEGGEIPYTSDSCPIVELRGGSTGVIGPIVWVNWPREVP